MAAQFSTFMSDLSGTLASLTAAGASPEFLLASVVICGLAAVFCAVALIAAMRAGAARKAIGAQIASMEELAEEMRHLTAQVEKTAAGVSEPLAGAAQGIEAASVPDASLHSRHDDVLELSRDAMIDEAALHKADYAEQTTSDEEAGAGAAETVSHEALSVETSPDDAVIPHDVVTEDDAAAQDYAARDAQSGEQAPKGLRRRLFSRR